MSVTPTSTDMTKSAGGKAQGRNQNPWVSYLLRRGMYFVVSMFVLVSLSFLLVQLIPGDPARISAGEAAPAELVEQRRTELGLDRPVIIQYLAFWGGLFTGDLGESITSRMPVIDVIMTRAPATLEPTGPATEAELAEKWLGTYSDAGTTLTVTKTAEGLQASIDQSRIRNNQDASKSTSSTVSPSPTPLLPAAGEAQFLTRSDHLSPWTSVAFTEVDDKPCAYVGIRCLPQREPSVG